MRGQKPLATAVKEANGTFVKNPKRRNKREPKAKPGKPKRPTSLAGDTIAIKKWNHVCKILAELNVLTKTDVEVIESYCLNESQMVASAEQMKIDGFGTRMNSSMSQWNRCMDRRIKLLAELGLTPSARSRLSAEPTDDKDPFLEFLELSKNN